MIKVTFNGTHAGVQSAVETSNQLLRDKTFFDRIRQKDRFDLSNTSPQVIADLMENANGIVTVTLYASVSPFSRALAYEDSRYPGTVFLNTRRLNRSVASICASIIHECVHSVDGSQTQYSFGHGDNSSTGKANTAPYWIDNLAYEMIRGVPGRVVSNHVDISTDVATPA